MNPRRNVEKRLQRSRAVASHEITVNNCMPLSLPVRCCCCGVYFWPITRSSRRDAAFEPIWIHSKHIWLQFIQGAGCRSKALRRSCQIHQASSMSRSFCFSPQPRRYAVTSKTFGKNFGSFQFAIQFGFPWVSSFFCASGAWFDAACSLRAMEAWKTPWARQPAGARHDGLTVNQLQPAGMPGCCPEVPVSHSHCLAIGSDDAHQIRQTWNNELD